MRMLERRNDEGIKELKGTEGLTNSTRGSHGVEGSMRVREGEMFKGGGHP